MLTAFLSANRDEILARARARVLGRIAPKPTDAELHMGIPLFLDQLIAVMEHPSQPRTTELTTSATKHGSDLLGLGFTVSQVVHDYGGICQAITELADEREAPMSSAEFRLLNKCLDDAIAAAVTEFGRQREKAVSDKGVESVGVLAHELRNQINIAMLAFEVLKAGIVGPSGSTAAMLERSLKAMRVLVERSFADVRLHVGKRGTEPVSIAELIAEVSASAAVEAESRGIHFTAGPVDPDVMLDLDRHHVAAALANLLQNAFKFTRPDGSVELRTRVTTDRVAIEVADECGGLPSGDADELFARFTQRGADRTGLGLGLAICREAAEAMGGKIHLRDLPGKGCVFTVDLPRQRTTVLETSTPSSRISS